MPKGGQLSTNLDVGRASGTPRTKDIVTFRMYNSTCCTMLALLAVVVAFMSGYWVREHQTAEAKARISQLEDLIITEVMEGEQAIVNNPLVHEIEERLVAVGQDLQHAEDVLVRAAGVHLHRVVEHPRGV